MKALSEGSAEEITWTEITLDGLILTVAADAMKGELGGRSGVRLPVSYYETVQACRSLGCVAPTQAMADAMFAQAKAQLQFVPLVRTAADSAKMASVDFTLRFHDGVEKQIAAAAPEPGALIAGAWKYWLLHLRLAERGAVNYGFWDKSKRPPTPIQTVGGRHDASHWDYSQLLQPVKRMARRVGSDVEVDLLEYIENHDHVPARFLEVFRPDAPITPQSFEDPYDDEVDLQAVLSAAGVEGLIHPAWREAGRDGFQPEGILVHHTAGPKTGEAPSLPVCIQGRPDLPGPLCHLYVSRSGKVHLLAAKITNHAGYGAKAVLDRVRRGEEVIGNARDQGYVDSVAGNAFLYGIEVENSGTAGDPYPQAQIDALVSVCAALCQAHSWGASRVIHHRQWTSRKIDMSFRGDLPGLVAQKMDAGAVVFGMSEDPSEPLWEPDPDVSPAT
jgi:hypothetical protein